MGAKSPANPAYVKEPCLCDFATLQTDKYHHFVQGLRIHFPLIFMSILTSDFLDTTVYCNYVFKVEGMSWIKVLFFKGPRKEHTLSLCKIRRDPAVASNENLLWYLISIPKSGVALA